MASASCIVFLAASTLLSSWNVADGRTTVDSTAAFPTITTAIATTKMSSADTKATQQVTQIAHPVATTPLPIGQRAEGRGMTDYGDHDLVYHDPHVEAVKEEVKAVKQDPWASYYEFIINEGSFKFWAVFQLGTALLLVYSALAAIYYAKLNPATSDYDYYDDFLFRSNGRSASGSETVVDSDYNTGEDEGNTSTPWPMAVNSTRTTPAPYSSWSSWFGIDANTVRRIMEAISSSKFS